MFLDRLFKPRWQSPRPEIRKQALLKLSPNSPEEAAVLLRLAEQDAEPDVRRSAIKRVSDLEFLRQRAQEDPDAGVREVASARYRQLLAGGTDAADLEARLAELARCGDDSVLAFAARRGREPELRLAALERVVNQAVLEDSAVNDESARVRQAAVARLTEAEALGRVLRQSRDKDKKVWKVAREALDVLEREAREREQALAQRRDLCEALEALAGGPWREGLRAEGLRLDNRWRAVSLPPNEELGRRFQAARERLEALIQTPPAAPTPAPEPPAPVASRLEAWLEAWLEELQQATTPDPSRLNSLEQRLAELEAHGLPTGEAEQAAHRHGLRLLGSYLEASRRYLARETELDAAVNGADEADPRAAGQTLRRLLEAVAWDAPLPRPPLLEAAEAALARLQARQGQVAEERALRMGQLDEVLAELEQQLGAGRLRESQRLLSRAQKIVGGLPAGDQARLERRLKAAAARVRELQDWRRFATLPKQEELCRQMEALIEADLEPPLRAERVRALQEAWKATGGSGAAESQQLWERFRAAADQAFEPCKAYFDEQARLRQQHLEQRERISAQLEEFIAAADWDRLELAALEAIRAQARKEWQAAAPVDRRTNAPIQTRFEAQMEVLSERIRAAQDTHRERKQALLRQAQALVEAEDLRGAIAEIKDLQARWKTIGPAQPAADRKLWREFRAACDALFARRDSARDEQDAQRQAGLTEARELLAEAEALAAAEDDQLERARATLAELAARLRAIAQLPREQARSLQADLRRLESELDARLQSRDRARQQADVAAVEAQAARCARLEILVQREPGQAQAQLAALQAEWNEQPPLPAQVQPMLEQRWQRAVAAAQGAGFSAEELAQAAQRQRELCVRLEILAGVESPPEDRALRMDLQVQRLAQGMAEGRRERPRELAQGLQLEWWGSGPATPESAAVEARFRAALDSIAP